MHLLDRAVTDIETAAAGLVNLAPVDLAETALQEARARFQILIAEARQADMAAQLAREKAAGLVGVALAGDTVDADRVDEVHLSAARAERYATFTATLARAAQAPIDAAEAALKDARHAAWDVVVQHGVGLRIAAARRADRARELARIGPASTSDDIAATQAAAQRALDVAESEWRRGEAFVQHATRHGWRFPRGNLTLPSGLHDTSERVERAFWGRPLTVEEFENAAE